jgi:hypothetical protein
MMRAAAIGRLGAAVTALAVGAGVAVAVAAEDEPEAPIPRVCWFSDYANAKLSNRCEYRSEERRWYMEVEGRLVPADRQELPVANLCLYVHGTSCPERSRSDP